jgi:electron transfer flavoprotein beta subunit
VWTAADINADPQRCGLNGSPTKVIRVFTPAARSDGEILVGEPDETAEQLVDKLMPVIVGASN